MQIDNAIVTPTNTHITDSCKVRSRAAIRKYLESLRESSSPEMAVNQRDIESQIREWRSHNLFYRLYVFRSRTKDVDLELKQTWYRELFCRVVSWFYFWDWRFPKNFIFPKVTKQWQYHRSDCSKRPGWTVFRCHGSRWWTIFACEVSSPLCHCNINPCSAIQNQGKCTIAWRAFPLRRTLFRLTSLQIHGKHKPTSHSVRFRLDYANDALKP